MARERCKRYIKLNQPLNVYKIENLTFIKESTADNSNLVDFTMFSAIGAETYGAIVTEMLPELSKGSIDLYYFLFFLLL